MKNGELAPEDITEDTITANLYTAHMPDPDLIIRPSGEIRTSNFLLWQSAYSGTTSPMCCGRTSKPPIWMRQSTILTTETVVSAAYNIN